MAARKIKNQPASLSGTPIAIYYDSEWQEYQVKVKGQPDATYHTDDKNDAISTAQHMRNTIAYKNPSSRKPTQSAIFTKANQLMREGYSRKQAFAVAYAELGEPKRVRKNPAPKRKTAARSQRAAEGYVRRPSQITKKAPSKRLKTRRIKNLQAPKGVFPNPSTKEKFYKIRFTDGKNHTAGLIVKKSQIEHMTISDMSRLFPYSEASKMKRLQQSPQFSSFDDAFYYDFDAQGVYKPNPDSVHFDIDVNSHNARGSRAKTRVNPAKRVKEITVEQSLDKKHWTIFARFPDTVEGSKNAIEYAKAYAKKEPYLHLRVMTK